MTIQVLITCFLITVVASTGQHGPWGLVGGIAAALAMFSVFAMGLGLE
ncbi:hypothetical protein [Ancylobacter pratisalsi]|uniref:Uncharacterized protein n=1 Tax=Ancylobacter pratisalsi TaxID=1745854 RepID=A0A6P1YN67_9HYPH|nr:hypothetical protein [Ancylobacter pratisalsi]QIB34769.1 hypothetical protein G3A50_14420 [Ancylobacter pratisalsi]